MTLTDMPTAWTLQRSSKSTTVEKENHLLASFKFLFHISPEPIRENRRTTFLFPGLVSHVDNSNERERLTVYPVGKPNELVFARLGVLEGFKRGGSGTENNLTVLKIPPYNGEVTPLILGRIFLFIGIFVLFVHNDETG